MGIQGQELPLISAKQQVEVERLLRQRTLHPRVRERLEMVKARALGEDLASIARWCGRSARRVAYWLERYSTGGPEALHDAPPAGGCRLSAGPGGSGHHPTARVGAGL